MFEVIRDGLGATPFVVKDDPLGGRGTVIGEGALTPEEYAAWVDWINPLTPS